ncbi:MAG TPA: thioredoxin family protein [Gaiellaceae bacterium]
MAAIAKPGLIFFHSSVSGRCRRVEGFLAQVLQRRRNHETFRFYSVAREQRPDLVEKFGIAALPTLVVIEESSVRARLEGPVGCREIETFLAAWLQ